MNKDTIVVRKYVLNVRTGRELRVHINTTIDEIVSVLRTHQIFFEDEDIYIDGDELKLIKYTTKNIVERIVEGEIK